MGIRVSIKLRRHGFIHVDKGLRKVEQRFPKSKNILRSRRWCDSLKIVVERSIIDILQDGTEITALSKAREKLDETAVRCRDFRITHMQICADLVPIVLRVFCYWTCLDNKRVM